eukprot:2928750-Amphidinium_carterae.1
MVVVAMTSNRDNAAFVRQSVWASKEFCLHDVRVDFVISCRVVSDNSKENVATINDSRALRPKVENKLCQLGCAQSLFDVTGSPKVAIEMTILVKDESRFCNCFKGSHFEKYRVTAYTYTYIFLPVQRSLLL